LPEVELFEPVCDLLHWRPLGLLVALDYDSSSSNAFASFRSRVLNPSVNHP
jgi:hypothetical protein